MAHGINAVALEEHVLGSAQADPGRTERDGIFHLTWRIGVGANLHLGRLGAPCHDLGKVFICSTALSGGLVFEQALDDFRRGGLDFARINLAAGAID